ncbi:hypothetical protein QQX98_005347 [Neonectria punicea]|uniref:Uncharacterized protein n=1 Tax=Neonectria punicea TaxID=979145 RepID=A0ABR1H5F0_9HYPO
MADSGIGDVRTSDGVVCEVTRDPYAMLDEAYRRLSQSEHSERPKHARPELPHVDKMPVCHLPGTL